MAAALCKRIYVLGSFCIRSRKHVHRVIVGIHLAVGGHIAQRVHGFDAHTGILVIHQCVEQCLANHFLRARAIERFDCLQPDGSVAILANRSAQRRSNFGIVAARAQAFHRIQPNIGAEALAAVEYVQQRHSSRGRHPACLRPLRAAAISSGAARAQAQISEGNRLIPATSAE